MFIVALITIAENWKQPKCPSKGERKKPTNQPTNHGTSTQGILFNYFKKTTKLSSHEKTWKNFLLFFKNLKNFLNFLLYFIFLEVGEGAEEAGERENPEQASCPAQSLMWGLMRDLISRP